MSHEHRRAWQQRSAAPAWTGLLRESPQPTASDRAPDQAPDQTPGYAPGHASGAPAPDLRAAVRELVAARLHGLCFSPYEPGQGPGTRVPERTVEGRLQLIAPFTRWIRSFSCTEGHEATPRLAHRAGLKTLVGAWLGKDRDINRREIEGAIELAREGVADLVAVGNEVLLRGDLEESELLEAIERVRSAAPHVPVGYVDAYFLFEKHPRVARACDVLMANCYPFWEGCPLEHAVAYMQDMYRRTCVAAEGKPVIIAETGWPDRGAAVGAALPSPEHAMRYLLEAQAWARRDGVEMFHFSAFDEAWKIDVEGDVGAFWGLWDQRGQFKYA